ncbi:hypothetical protein HDU96_006170 [Phlyctochytrium bullatum]|nr:hypothetical protein HDU96_006170 [Phlyctochytrium bullatum]
MRSFITVTLLAVIGFVSAQSTTTASVATATSTGSSGINLSVPDNCALRCLSNIPNILTNLNSALCSGTTTDLAKCLKDCQSTSTVQDLVNLGCGASNGISLVSLINSVVNGASVLGPLVTSFLGGGSSPATSAAATATASTTSKSGAVSVAGGVEGVAYGAAMLLALAVYQAFGF